VVPGDGTEVWGKIHMNWGRVGEERRGRKRTDVPLHLYHEHHLKKIYLIDILLSSLI
jgi:hypothetical protein